MCNELTTLMAVRDDPPQEKLRRADDELQAEDLLRFMEAMARIIDGHQKAMKAFNVRLGAIEEYLAPVRETTSDKN